MSTYAILGATGSTGLSILQILGASPTAKVNVLVRSRSKLESLYPSLPSNPNITVFEGSISDHAILTSCLAHTNAAFLTVASTFNALGTRIAQDTGHAVVAALQQLRKDAGSTPYKPPRLVVLSSASLDDKFWGTAPSFVHRFMWNANIHIYTDLEKQESYLRSHEDWLTCVFVMPGGLTHDVQKGHEISTERQQTFLGWLDLAAAMVEVADEGEGRWDGGRVSVVLKGGQKARFEWMAPVVLAKGFMCYMFPWLEKWLR